MDLVARCQGKLVAFRLKELKDVLSRVGISKQGKKQDLVDRILALLYDEGTPGLLKKHVNGKEAVMEIIDDVHRKMLEPGVSDLAVKKQSSSDTSKGQLKEDTEGSFHRDVKIRCPCGGTLMTESLIQCEDPDCKVWQHICCVIVPDKPMENISLPAQFFCEICRVKRADPFWLTMSHPVHPAKLAVSNIPDDSSNPFQSIEKTFQLTTADRDLLKKSEYDVQAWCVLLNDSVPFRMQWPQYAELQFNGMPIQTSNRPGSQLLGANGRDDGARISLYIAEGANKISLSGCDARVFCFGIRLVKRRTLQEVLNMIPKEGDGELFEDALARVQRCIGGGITAGAEDGDSDLEVVTESITVNLRCPMSGSRMKTAGRFKPCAHMGCFDLETFVKLNERSRKWQCPICLKNYSLDDVTIDPYFNCIVSMMRKCGEEMTEIDVKPDGSWRVKNANEFKDLAVWHYPDGREVISTPESLKLNDQENASRKCSPKLSTRGYAIDYGVGDPHDNSRLNSNQLNDLSENFDQKVITMSSTGTGDGRNDEGPSINQDGGDQIGISDIDENEINSVLVNCGVVDKIVDQSSIAPVGNFDVIVLSDSEEDEVSLAHPETASAALHCSNGGFSAIPQSPGWCPAVDSVVRSGVLNRTGNELRPFPYASSSQAGSAFHFSGKDTNVSGAFDHLEQTDGIHSGPSSSCSLSLDFSTNPRSHVLSSIVYPYDNAPGDNLVNNHLHSTDNNPSLRDLFSSHPASGNQLPLVCSTHDEDLISLRLETGGSDGCSISIEAQAEAESANGTYFGEQLRAKAPSFTNMNGESGSNLTNSRKRTEGPFSFPRQPRSTRRRPNLRVYSGTELN
ncbi:hypothetical protein Ancab_001399 [Ancistrocladus abbreviatus]